MAYAWAYCIACLPGVLDPVGRHTFKGIVNRVLCIEPLWLLFFHSRPRARKKIIRHQAEEEERRVASWFLAMLSTVRKNRALPSLSLGTAYNQGGKTKSKTTTVP